MCQEGTSNLYTRSLRRNTGLVNNQTYAVLNNRSDQQPLTSYATSKFATADHDGTKQTINEENESNSF